MESSKRVCIPAWLQNEDDAKAADETICVCWTMSFSFIAIIMELTYKTFDNSLLLFQEWKNRDTLQIYICQENGSPHTTCLPVYLFFLQPYALCTWNKNKASKSLKCIFIVTLNGLLGKMILRFRFHSFQCSVYFVPLGNWILAGAVDTKTEKFNFELQNAIKKKNCKSWTVNL